MFQKGIGGIEVLTFTLCTLFSFNLYSQSCDSVLVANQVTFLDGREIDYKTQIDTLWDDRIQEIVLCVNSGKNGAISGLSKCYDLGCILVSERNFLNGVLNGSTKYYNINGGLTYEAIYKNGKLLIAKDFFSSGKISALKVFLNGDVLYHLEYNSNGNISQLKVN